MDIIVKGKQIDLGDALQAHVSETLPGVVGKYFSKAIEAEVVFSKERSHVFKCDMIVHAGRHIRMVASGEASDPYIAYDQASDRLAKQLRRYKRRLADHHLNYDVEARLAASAYVVSSEPEELAEGHEEPEEPVIIAEMETVIETLTPGEALMRLDLASLPALMFRNRAHGGLNMIYRRPDGNIGWVDPRGTQATV